MGERKWLSIAQILLIAMALILVVATFTPLVTPLGIYEPKLIGLPYTLWVGILITIGLVLLTLFSTRIHKLTEKGTDE